mgnify:CR=1 FL=1
MNDVARVAVVDDDRAIRWVLERALAQPDLEVECIERGDTALERLLADPPDVLVTDIRMPGIDGLDLMAKVREAHPELPVIVMTAHSDLDSAVASYQGGAFEYLPKPGAPCRGPRSGAPAPDQRARGTGCRDHR